MPISNDEFRAALGSFASGVTVVTTMDGAGRAHGITVSAFCSVSLEPHLVLICIEKSTASHYAFEESGMFVVNILSEDQPAISERFASPNIDKFDGIGHTIGELEPPFWAEPL
jgi:flavin reductase (DIM6/NTAB) family NADH-FMN oxidoreductase RutF